jgi:hypothetical protein
MNVRQRRDEEVKEEEGRGKSSTAVNYILVLILFC